MSSLERVNGLVNPSTTRNYINYNQTNSSSKPPLCPAPRKLQANKRNELLKQKYKEISKKHCRCQCSCVTNQASSFRTNKTQRSWRKSLSQLHRKFTSKYTIDDEIITNRINFTPKIGTQMQQTVCSRNSTEIKLRKKMKIDFESFKQYLHYNKSSDGTCDQILFDDTYVKHITQRRIMSDQIFESNGSCK